MRSTAAWGHTCATKRDGSEVCWGWNNYGQLGDGTTTDSLVPVPVDGVHHAIATALGYWTSCIVNTAHTVSCWGYGPSGERGDNSTTETETHPTAVFGLRNVVHIAYDGCHACALVTSGDELCWGLNQYGEVGNGGTDPALSPTAVADLHNVAAIGNGPFHSLAQQKDGTTKAWGYNYLGQLGDGTTTDSAVPVGVS